MNWLMYIGGWVVFGSIAWAMVFGTLPIDAPRTVFEGVANERGSVMFWSWTMVWAWICWRFIR